MRANYSRKFHFRMALSCHGALAHPPIPHCKIKNDPNGSFSILVELKISTVFHIQNTGNNRDFVGINLVRFLQKYLFLGTLSGNVCKNNREFILNISDFWQITI